MRRIAQAVFSPDSRYLAAAYVTQSRSLFRLWELATAHAIVDREFAHEGVAVFDFDAASSHLFVASRLSLQAFDVRSGELLDRIQVAEPVQALWGPCPGGSALTWGDSRAGDMECSRAPATLRSLLGRVNEANTAE